MAEKRVSPADVRAALARDEAEARKVFPKTRATAKLLNSAYQKATGNKRKIRSLWRDVTALIRMIRAYKNKSYRQIPKRTIIAALAALIYFLDPFDLIPDAIPLIGYIDDAAVMGLVMSLIRDDLENFQEWEGTIEMGEPTVPTTR
jgi:uncharacterized membrane protein YkvA (DUF1232 family)